MVEPEHMSTAEQQITNHVPVTTNNSKQVIARQQIAQHEMFRSN
jgi:hypothetical protein